MISKNDYITSTYLLQPILIIETFSYSIKTKKIKSTIKKPPKSQHRISLHTQTKPEQTVNRHRKNWNPTPPRQLINSAHVYLYFAIILQPWTTPESLLHLLVIGKRGPWSQSTARAAPGVSVHRASATPTREVFGVFPGKLCDIGVRSKAFRGFWVGWGLLFGWFRFCAVFLCEWFLVFDVWFRYGF